MQVKFHGPIDRVTGSCYELYEPIANKRFLIDCGMVQGEGEAENLNRAPFPFDLASLDFMVLTHAHLDHCGRIPLLYKRGFRGTVYATEETKKLAILVLNDAARHGAPYARKDIKRIRFHEHSKALFGRRLPVGKDLYLRFYRSGHLLGATSVGVVWGPDPKLGSARPQRTINFSGDLGPNLEDREQLPFLRHMMKPTPGDYAVVESTYGGSVRPLEDGDAEIRISRLNVALREGLARGGPVIIPAFAMGRTQDLLFDLHLLFARHPHFNGVPVHLDGAMALKASKITATSIGRLHSVSGNRQKLAWLGKQVFKLFGLKLDDADDEAILVDALKEMLHPGHVPEQPRTGPFERWRRIYQVVDPKKRASISGPCIILTGGGMCNGGPVQEYLKQHLREPEATVLLTGYCSVGTVGQELAHLGRLPPEEWRRLNERLGLDDVSIRKREVEATIQVMSGYSAHADQRGLLEWLFYRMPGDEYWSSAGKHVFVTHGNPTARRQLAVATEHRARMLDIDVEANLPGSDRWFDLDEDRWVEEEMSELEMLRARYEELERKSSKMEEGNLCAV